MTALAKAKGEQDARRAPRQRALLRARLTYSQGAITLDCLVTQISATGAKINIAEDVALPETVEIEIPLRKIRARARVVRRDADSAALAFESEAQGPQANLAALQERVRVLEAENRMLRANCAALAAQLDRDTANY